MMDLVSSISGAQQAETSTQVAYAVAAKVLDTTSTLQTDLIDKMLGKMGIGSNLNMVA